MTNSANNLHLFPYDSSLSKTDPLYYESLARKHGYQWIAGVDEAGRGPLAGPVVAAAVIIPEGALLQGVKDSKKMTEKAREKAFEEIHKIAVAVGVGVISHRAIDQMNILNATLTAMKQAVVSLDPLPDHVFVDGIHEIPISIPQKCLIKGDQICKSISAASIIAKVYRDRIMSSYHDRFPEYGFLHHKGYGTAQHRSVIAFLGPSPVHRLTFKGVKGLDTGKN